MPSMLTPAMLLIIMADGADPGLFARTTDQEEVVSMTNALPGWPASH